MRAFIRKDKDDHGPRWSQSCGCDGCDEIESVKYGLIRSLSVESGLRILGFGGITGLGRWPWHLEQIGELMNRHRWVGPQVIAAGTVVALLTIVGSAPVSAASAGRHPGPAGLLPAVRGVHNTANKPADKG